MAIKLGGNTNITLTNTSFDISDATQDVVVPLFTATSDGTYYFEGDLQDGRAMSTLIRVNNTAKDIWTYWDGVVHHVNCEFTLVTGDVVQILTAGTGQGRNFTVVRYADEIKEIYVGEGNLVNDYSAMRGPAPSGYHVPLTTEWQGLKTIMDGLSLTTGNSWRINLHMPFAGYRGYRDGTVYGQRRRAYYWSSSPRGGLYPEYAWNLPLGPSIVDPSSIDNRTNGQSLRCFKDSYVTPDSSWAVVQGTLGSAGIFRNQSEGLISITDGTTGYTIMDKNLGATTVYNDGDTLTQANMGNMYQWGNNYGFPSTGTISNTSSTQVDASAYGPGNYYLSDTFITGSEDWSSVQNDNLRGGETGVQQKHIGNVIEVYVGTTKVRPSSGQQQQSGGSGQGENNGGNR